MSYGLLVKDENHNEIMNLTAKVIRPMKSWIVDFSSVSSGTLDFSEIPTMPDAEFKATYQITYHDNSSVILPYTRQEWVGGVNKVRELTFNNSTSPINTEMYKLDLSIDPVTKVISWTSKKRVEGFGSWVTGDANSGLYRAFVHLFTR